MMYIFDEIKQDHDFIAVVFRRGCELVYKGVMNGETTYSGIIHDDGYIFRNAKKNGIDISQSLRIPAGDRVYIGDILFDFGVRRVGDFMAMPFSHQSVPYYDKRENEMIDDDDPFYWEELDAAKDQLSGCLKKILKRFQDHLSELESEVV